MTVGMQGSWTVSVLSKEAGWAQRFRIEGSTNGVDGTYTGDVATPSVFVTGAQWGITVEHNPTGPVSWTQSRHRLANFRVVGGQFLFDITTDDSAGDEDFDDLVLTCSMPLADSEFVVYGRVRTYTGFCWFNPCFPWWYWVIDTPLQLRKLLEFEPARRVIEKLYPERVKPYIKRPFPPPPPPEPFRPMMIPTGLADDPGLVVRGKAMVMRGGEMKSQAMMAGASEMAGMRSFQLGAERTVASYLDAADLRAIANIRDRFWPIEPCEVNPVSETLLRFLEYDRTAAELLGDPYTGTGTRTTLGQTATDEQGYYVFHFSHTLAEIVAEASDVAVGEDLTTQIRPDVILQIMESLPDGVAYESAPYYNIPNVKRIDLCLPEDSVGRPPTACQGGRAIQAIGNLFIVPNPGTTLHADGTITNTSGTGPIVDHAAWWATLDLFACFLDASPAVTRYTIRYRRDGESDWLFVSEPYSHLKQQPDATWLSTSVGPSAAFALAVDGGAPVLVDSYENIESNPDWLFTHRDRKVQLNSALYQAVAGGVTFWIEGYDAAGNRVPGAEDSVYLYIDNHLSEGDVDYIMLGAVDPGECALFELPSAGAPLTVRYRVTDIEGFMSNYALSVYRGSNTFVPTEDTVTGSPVSFSYSAVFPFRFGGTLDQVVDPTGYREIDLEPSSGAWLPEGINFCAFSFELGATDRLTNGYGGPGGRTLWRELIGISFTPPPGP